MYLYRKKLEKQHICISFGRIIFVCGLKMCIWTKAWLVYSLWKQSVACNKSTMMLNYRGTG